MHDATAAEREIRWINRSTPVSAEIICSACGDRGIATYALGSAVKFAGELAHGAIKCAVCDAAMQPFVEAIAIAPAKKSLILIP